MLRVAFRGIPKRWISSIFIFAVLYGVFNAAFAEKISELVDVNIDNEMIKYIAYVILLIFMWNTAEFIGDVITYVFGTVVENVDYNYYFNRLYNIKPEVLSKNNTGYISGLLNMKIFSKLLYVIFQ